MAKASRRDGDVKVNGVKRFAFAVALIMIGSGAALSPSDRARAEEPPATSAATTPAPSPADRPALSARDAGIRYGQATGVAIVCENMRTTAKAAGLSAAFTGADLDAFRVQAETVLQSWKKTLTCSHMSDPNPCRLAHQISCREALREIGPNGTVVDGLIEIATP